MKNLVATQKRRVLNALYDPNPRMDAARTKDICVHLQQFMRERANSPRAEASRHAGSRALAMPSSHALEEGVGRPGVGPAAILCTIP
jgi:hypothetical protein